MEIIIEGNQNNRYQHTFGVSEDNYDVSEINPLEESGSTQITQKKIIRNETLDVEDDCESYEFKDNSSKISSSNKYSDTLKSVSPAEKDVNIPTRFDQRADSINSSAQKQFKMSFKFENKELVSLNKDKPTFNSDGLQDSLAASGSLLATSSLKEFEEIHQQAKTALSKGNFSFGNCFYKESSIDQFGFKNSDNEEEEEPKANLNYNPTAKEQELKNPRKQWNRKPHTQAKVESFEEEDWTKEKEEVDHDEYEQENFDYDDADDQYAQDAQDAQDVEYNWKNQRTQIPYNPEQFEDDWDNEQVEAEDQEYEDQDFEEEDEQAQEEPRRKNIALENKEAKREQFLKKRQEFEEKRKLDSQRKKVENKDKTEDTPKYAKIVQPQSVKTKGSQKQVDVNQEGGDRGYTEIATVKTKSKVSKLSEPITELKNKIKRQNLMDEGGEEKKGNLFSGVNRSPLTNLTKKQKEPPVKISQPSNKKIIKNAICAVCLAGEACKEERELVLQSLEEIKSNYYLILLQTSLGRQKFKGLYSHDGNGNVSKIYGNSSVPLEIKDENVSKFFRYNSGAKEFKEIVGMKRFGVSADAISLNTVLEIPNKFPKSSLDPSFNM